MSKYINAAREMRSKYQALAEHAPDEAAYAVPEAYDLWAVDLAYERGNIRRHGGGLYRCVQGHTSQAGWEPDRVPALWARIADPALEWPEWIQPINAETAYNIGAKVSHGGRRWTSNVDANVWEPGAPGITTWEEVIT